MQAEVLGSEGSDATVATAEVFRVGPFDDPDRYEIGEPVEAGAEGILYRGQLTTPTTRLSLPVAVKALQPVYSERIDQWAARWRDQVELLRSLHIPGLVGVREGFVGPLPHLQGAETAGRNLYLVMNWVEGEALDSWVLRNHRIDVGNALKLLLPVAVAIDTMHSGQLTGGVPVVHRDIKPANILISKDSSVLVDFGLTRGLSSGHPVGRAGTPGYIAPEVVSGGAYSPAADRYAFGATVFFLLSGRHPSTGIKPAQLRHLLENAPAAAATPADLVDRVVAMLDPDPGRRPVALANWIAQLRQSSLDDEILSTRLAPPAPARARQVPLDRPSAGTAGTGTGSAATLGTTAGAGSSGTAATSGSFGAGTFGTLGAGTFGAGTSGAGTFGTLGAGTAGAGTSGTGTFGATGSEATAGVSPHGSGSTTGPQHRSAAHRTHRPPLHARQRARITRHYALALILVVALVAVASDTGAAGHPGHLVSTQSEAPTGEAGSNGLAIAGGSRAAASGLRSSPAGFDIRSTNALPETGTTTGPTTSSTAVPAASIRPCFQSYDPACGPFHWDPQPVNQPLTVAFWFTPANPMPGDVVTFDIVLDDPDDAQNLQIDAAYFGQEAGNSAQAGTATAVVPSGTGCQTPHGAWTPPPPGPRGHTTKQMTYVYTTPGSYQVYFTASSGAGYNACAPPDPYANTGTSATETVTVTAPPPPSTTTTSTTVPAPTTTTTVATSDPS